MRKGGRQIRDKGTRWITAYDKATERAFFFYATVVMLVLWAAVRLFGH